MRLGFRGLSLSFSIASFLTATADDATVTDTGINRADAVIAWIRTEGGFYNDKLEIRRRTSDHPDDDYSRSRYVTIATDDIEAGEILMDITLGAIIYSLEYEEESEERDIELNCGTVRNLAEEMRLGDGSKYARYVTYMMDAYPPGLLPSAWSEAGQSLLLEVLGWMEYDDDDDGGMESLPPYQGTEWITEDWIRICGGSDVDLERRAALLVVQAGRYGKLVPIIDTIRHRNGRRVNAESGAGLLPRNGGTVGGGAIGVRASRDIGAGEEILSSYNLCEECGRWSSRYGTPEILRDYGFVEGYPQRWFFPSHEVAFEVDAVYDDRGEETGRVELTRWIESEPSDHGIQFLEDELQRLLGIGETILASRAHYSAVLEHEWNVIADYHNAMVLAMSLAIEQANEGHFTCLEEEGSCPNFSDRYVDLDEDTEGIEEEEYHSHTPPFDQVRLA